MVAHDIFQFLMTTHISRAAMKDSSNDDDAEWYCDCHMYGDSVGVDMCKNRTSEMLMPAFLVCFSHTHMPCADGLRWLYGAYSVNTTLTYYKLKRCI